MSINLMRYPSIHQHPSVLLSNCGRSWGSRAAAGPPVTVSRRAGAAKAMTKAEGPTRSGRKMALRPATTPPAQEAPGEAAAVTKAVRAAARAPGGPPTTRLNSDWPPSYTQYLRGRPNSREMATGGSVWEVCPKTGSQHQLVLLSPCSLTPTRATP